MICKLSIGGSFGKALRYDMNPKTETAEAKESVAPEADREGKQPASRKPIAADEQDEFNLNVEQIEREIETANWKAERAAKFPAVSASADGPAYAEGQRHRIIGGNMAGETVRELTNEFAAVRALRQGVKKPVHHAKLSAAPGDHLTASQWREIGEQYVEKMGFEDCPYVVVQHRDKAHDHIHIVISRVTLEGRVVSDWQSKMRSEAIMRDIEQQYDLRRVKPSREALRRASTHGELEMMSKTGEPSVKLVLQERIKAVLESRPTTTQFIERLQEKGINVAPNLQSTGRVSGISFELDGKAMKGKSLGNGYSWQGLQERGLSYEPERDFQAVVEASERMRRRQQQLANIGKDCHAVSSDQQHVEPPVLEPSTVIVPLPDIASSPAESSASEPLLAAKIREVVMHGTAIEPELRPVKDAPAESNGSQPQKDEVPKQQVIIGFQTYVAHSIEEAALARNPEITRDAFVGYKLMTGEEISDAGRAHFARLIIECEENKPTDPQLKAIKTLAEKGSPMPLGMDNRLDAADHINNYTIAQGGESLWTRTALVAEAQAREAKIKNTPEPISDVGIRLGSPFVDSQVATAIALDTPLTRKQSAGREEVDVLAVNLSASQIYDPESLLEGTSRGDARMSTAAQLLEAETTSSGRAIVLAKLGYTAEVRRQDDKPGVNREIVVYDKAAIQTIETKLTPDTFRERLAGDGGRAAWTQRAENLRDAARVMPIKTALGEEVATSLDLDNAQTKLESMRGQGDIRRHKIETENGKTRRLSIRNVEALASAQALRHVNRIFDAAHQAEQTRPREEQRSAAALRAAMLKETRTGELEKQKNVLAAIRDKHAGMVARLGSEHAKAKDAYTQASERANLIRRDYELRGEELPAPMISATRLDDLEIAAVDRGAIDSLKTIEGIRSRSRQELLEQGVEASDPRANRSEESAACIRAQHRLGEVHQQMSEHRLQDFEESYWTRRVEIEGHDRNMYLPAWSREEAEQRALENKPENKWSLSDVQKAIRTAEKTQSWLTTQAEFFEERASISESIKQQLDPLNELRGTADWLTNPKETMLSHLNPLNAAMNDPMVRGVRFIFEAEDMKNQAQATRAHIEGESVKLENLRGVIEGEVSAKLGIQGDELRGKVSDARGMRGTLQEIVTHEREWREANNQRMPNAKFEDFELRRIEGSALEMGNGKLLREYEGYAVEAKNQKMLAQEDLPGRAQGRAIIAEKRVLDAKAKIEMLDKPIGEDGLTARDFTRVNVKLPEGRTQLMSLEDAAEATGEVQAAVRDALDIHESSLQGALAEAEEFHAATTGIVEEYEAFLKAHHMKLPKVQFNAKEHIEIERFAARVEEDELHDRFGKIAEDALRGGRVIGIEKSNTIGAPQTNVENQFVQEIESNVASQQNAWNTLARNAEAIGEGNQAARSSLATNTAQIQSTIMQDQSVQTHLHDGDHAQTSHQQEHQHKMAETEIDQEAAAEDLSAAAELEEIEAAESFGLLI